MPERDVFIISAVRTAIGVSAVDGGTGSFEPAELAAAVLKEAVVRAGILPARVEDVLWGFSSDLAEHVGSFARRAARRAGFPESVTGVDLDRGLASSQQAIHSAAQAILAGDADILLAGGSGWSAGQAAGSQLEAGQVEGMDRAALQYGFSRADLDDYAFQSQTRAAAANQKGFFSGQILTMTWPDGRQWGQDELVCGKPDREKLASFMPRLGELGLTTAGNSCQAVDGAAAVLLASAEAVGKLNLMPLARIETRVAVGSDPALGLDSLVKATRLALERSGLALAELGVIEIQEQSAGLVLAWAREMGVDLKKVNPNGGALAHGQPRAATGAVLMTKLVNELERRKARFGLLCVGGADGQCLATLVERL